MNADPTITCLPSVPPHRGDGVVRKSLPLRAPRADVHADTKGGSHRTVAGLLLV